MSAKDKPFYKGRYEPVLGFNSKQWWAYDTETGELCEPPTEVLKRISVCGGLDEEGCFQEILDTNPDWLYDEGYRFDGEMEI